jgi:hypothetical protein
MTEPNPDRELKIETWGLIVLGVLMVIVPIIHASHSFYSFRDIDRFIFMDLALVIPGGYLAIDGFLQLRKLRQVNEGLARIAEGGSPKDDKENVFREIILPWILVLGAMVLAVLYVIWRYSARY